MFFPVMVHCLDIVVSSVGIWFVKTTKGVPDFGSQIVEELEDPLAVMKKGYRVSMLLGLVGFAFISYLFLNPAKHSQAWICYALCGLIGALVAFSFIEITQYYTDYNYKPVKKIVAASKTGHATNIIQGLSVGLESTGVPVLIIAVGLLGSYYLGESTSIVDSRGELIGGLFGTAIATMGMFTTAVFILSMSGFGPIAVPPAALAALCVSVSSRLCA